MKTKLKDLTGRYLDAAIEHFIVDKTDRRMNYETYEQYIKELNNEDTFLNNFYDCAENYDVKGLLPYWSTDSASALYLLKILTDKYKTNTKMEISYISGYSCVIYHNSYSSRMLRDGYGFSKESLSIAICYAAIEARDLNDYEVETD